MIDQARLRQLYLDQQLSIRAIALLEHVPTRTIYDALVHYRIPRRPAGFRSPRDQPAPPPFDEATLRQLYLEEQRSIRYIAALYQVSTRMVYDALSRYRIPRRTAGYRRPPAMLTITTEGVIDEAALRQLYEKEGQSIAAIAARLSCTPSRVRNALVRWGIARRRRGRRESSAGANAGS